MVVREAARLGRRKGPATTPVGSHYPPDTRSSARWDAANLSECERLIAELIRPALGELDARDVTALYFHVVRRARLDQIASRIGLKHKGSVSRRLQNATTVLFQAVSRAQADGGRDREAVDDCVENGLVALPDFSQPGLLDGSTHDPQSAWAVDDEQTPAVQPAIPASADSRSRWPLVLSLMAIAAGLLIVISLWPPPESPQERSLALTRRGRRPDRLRRPAEHRHHAGATGAARGGRPLFPRRLSLRSRADPRIHPRPPGRRRLGAGGSTLKG